MYNYEIEDRRIQEEVLYKSNERELGRGQINLGSLRERYEPEKVQAFIDNISAPKSLDELRSLIDRGQFYVEDILSEFTTEWTVPRWAMVGDVVFFMHTKTAISSLTALRTELQQSPCSPDEYKLLMYWINKGIDLYKKYGGKIFAIGRVCGAPEIINGDRDDYIHWGINTYAKITEVTVLETPIDISEFNRFITVTRGSSITAVFGKEYLELRDVISKKNKIPAFFEKRNSVAMPLSRIAPRNWLGITNEYRRRFLLESQFRSYYVDYLLQEIGDYKKTYRECTAKKTGHSDTFVDNIIRFNGKYLPVEVKLSIPFTANLENQLKQYCNVDRFILDSKTGKTAYPDQLYNEKVLVIDTQHICMYDRKQDQIVFGFPLDEIRTKEHVMRLRKVIREWLYAVK